MLLRVTITWAVDVFVCRYSSRLISWGFYENSETIKCRVRKKMPKYAEWWSGRLPVWHKRKCASFRQLCLVHSNDQALWHLQNDQNIETSYLCVFRTWRSKYDGVASRAGRLMMMSWCLMSSDVIWHIRDKLWPMPKHGSIILYVHGNQKAR